MDSGVLTTPIINTKTGEVCNHLRIVRNTEEKFVISYFLVDESCKLGQVDFYLSCHEVFLLNADENIAKINIIKKVNAISISNIRTSKAGRERYKNVGKTLHEFVIRWGINLGISTFNLFAFDDSCGFHYRCGYRFTGAHGFRNVILDKYCDSENFPEVLKFNWYGKMELSPIVFEKWKKIVKLERK